MNLGLGFGEILIILLLVLVFFGSKELPQFIRAAARFLARVRQYSDQVQREFDEAAKSLDPPAAGGNAALDERKAQLRTQFAELRDALSPEQCDALSGRIADQAMALDEVKRARAVMVYLHKGNEVRTDALVARLRQEGKRVAAPYARTVSRDLGIAEVREIDTDTAIGEFGIREPLPALRDNFLKSDIQVVLVPGVAFDKRGGRLGRGKGYYDNFLREISGRVPLVGLAYQCQISSDTFPFDYRDVPMDQVVTEEGCVVARGAAASLPAVSSSSG